MKLFEKTDVSKDLKNKILLDLGITETTLDQHLDAIKQWIPNQHHFPTTKIDDTLLRSFIIGSKGKLDKAKSKLDAYFTSRAKFPDIFSNRDPLDTNFVRFARALPFVTLRDKTRDGHRVHITWIEGGDYDLTGWTKRVVAQWEILLRTDPWSAGEIFLVSGNNLTFAHATKIQPTQVSTLFSLAQHALPIRIQSVQFYSAPPACEFVVNKILKTFMTKKLSERVCIHSGDHKVFVNVNLPVKMMPADFGGESCTLSTYNESWIENITSHRNWFMDEGTLTTDENKRPTATPDAFGGVLGTFRTLQID